VILIQGLAALHGIPVNTTGPPIVIPCYDYYNYEICADDGTNNRDSYYFEYININGNLVQLGVTNKDCRTITCARENSVTTASPWISITKQDFCSTDCI